MELKSAQPQEQAHQQPAAHYEKIQGHQAEDEEILDEINNSYVADTVRIWLLMWLQQQMMNSHCTSKRLLLS